ETRDRVEREKHARDVPELALRRHVADAWRNEVRAVARRPDARHGWELEIVEIQELQHSVRDGLDLLGRDALMERGVHQDVALLGVVFDRRAFVDRRTAEIPVLALRRDA